MGFRKDMIYDWTDPIFAWKGWNVIKWIFGALVTIGLLYLIWMINTSCKFEHNIISYFNILFSFLPHCIIF